MRLFQAIALGMGGCMAIIGLSLLLVQNDERFEFMVAVGPMLGVLWGCWCAIKAADADFDEAMGRTGRRNNWPF